MSTKVVGVAVWLVFILAVFFFLPPLPDSVVFGLFAGTFIGVLFWATRPEKRT